jgi:hypothetical protein
MGPYESHTQQICAHEMHTHVRENKTVGVGRMAEIRESTEQVNSERWCL